MTALCSEWLLSLMDLNDFFPHLMFTQSSAAHDLLSGDEQLLQPFVMTSSRQRIPLLGTL